MKHIIITLIVVLCFVGCTNRNSANIYTTQHTIGGMSYLFVQHNDQKLTVINVSLDSLNAVELRQTILINDIMAYPNSYKLRK